MSCNVSPLGKKYEKVSSLHVTDSKSLLIKWKFMVVFITSWTYGFDLTKNYSDFELGVNVLALRHVFQDLQGIDSKYFFGLFNSPELLPCITASLSFMIERLEPLTYSKQVLIDRIRTTKRIHFPMREMLCGLIRMRLKFIYTLLQDNYHITGWKIPKALFVDNHDLDIKSLKKGILMFCKEEYGINSDIETLSDYEEVKEYMMATETAPYIEYLNWSLTHQSDNFLCPATYVLATCKTSSDLLEVSEYFQRTVGELEEMDSSNIFFIFFMCCALLDKASSLEEDISEFEIHALFDIVFCTLNFILPQFFKIHDERFKRAQILAECTCIYKLSSTFKSKFSKTEGKFLDYMDILFKYKSALTMCDFHFNPEIEAKLFYKWQKSVAYVYRKYLPNEIEGNLPFWRLKFFDLRNLEDVIREAEPKPMCTICGQKFDELNKTDEMAILERCNHLFCAKCLMSNINKVSHTYIEALAEEKYFQCPQPNCSPKQAGFILGKDYERLRSLHKDNPCACVKEL